MAISLKHQFASLKSDGLDTTLVQPSNWNDEHALTCATDKLLGRVSTGTGAVEEISVSDFVQALLNSADAAAFLAAMGVGAFTTGDAKFTIKITADAGWVMANDGTIGDALSGATHANSNAQALFILIFNSIGDANAPIFTSGGVSTTRVAEGNNSLTAWAAHCRISLPKMLGRALAVAGAGSGLTFRALAALAGAESHVLALPEIPSHSHPNSLNDPGHIHFYNGSLSGSSFPRLDAAQSASNQAATTSAFTGMTITNGFAGGSGAHNNMQPSTFLNVMVKL